MSKKISQLDPASSSEVQNDGSLFAIADPITGLAKQATRAQVKVSLSVTSLQYTATGGEGTTLTLGALAGKDVLFIAREAGILFRATSLPMQTSEYTWDDTSIELGAATNLNERFIILYSAY